MTSRAMAWRPVLVLASYLAIAILYTHPLVEHLSDGLANDRYDPVLNASILWWNATTVPFSTAWWTPPHYYPSVGIAAFTENLVGLSFITTPILWATQDPVLTYNLAFLLSWPLSAFAVYLLALRLGLGHSAAVIGGIAFGFAPYRISQMAHLQVLSCYWLPLALAGLHGYLAERRRRWLVLFGAAWVLQSLTNGYFMLFGAVLIAMWLAYFCSARAMWTAARPIVIAWAIASVPLLPIMLIYQRVHAEFGLVRELAAIRQYAAEPFAWLQVSELAALWGGPLRDGGGESSLFPGAAVILLVVAAWTLAAFSTRIGPAPPMRRLVRILALITAVSCGVAVLIALAIGPWRISPFGFSVRVSSVGRPALIAVLSLIAFRLLGGRWLHASERRPLTFYACATIAIAVLCMGPQIQFGSRLLLDPAPYGWLMVLPGFEGLRVPTRFWMLGTLCLAMAAALAFDRLAPAHRGWRLPLAALLSLGILAEGWLREMPIARAPEHWPRVEPRASERALLELPLGPEWDAAATFRAVRHRRRVVNGVSGYEPPHYGLLQAGLNAYDPSVLLALASLGPLDVVVDSSADRDGEWERYVAAIPGAARAVSDGIRTMYRMPEIADGSARMGAALSIAAIHASIGDGSGVRSAADGDLATAWTLAVQIEGASVTLDLGAPRAIAGVSTALGASRGGYPRHLAVDASIDGSDWVTIWEGPGLGPALAGIMRAPGEGRLLLPFEARVARHVRLRVAATAQAPWTIAEVAIHSPAATVGPGPSR